MIVFALLLCVLLWLPHPAWSAFPVVAATTSTGDTAGTTSHTVNLPTGISSGHLLMVFLTCRNSSLTMTFPAGWTKVGTEFTSGGVGLGHSHNVVYYRIADGGEGSSITVTTSGTNACSSVANRITGHHASTAPESGTAVSATTANPNPPNLAPSWGAEDTLWVAMAGSVGSRTTSVYPYASGNVNVPTGGSVTNHVTLSYCEQSLNASSSDPGTFTIDSSVDTAAQTIAIRPAVVSNDAGSEAVWFP